MNAKSILLLATYGMEVVECGGTLAKHGQNGGNTNAAIALSRPESRVQIKEAAAVLGVEVSFLDLTAGEVYADKKSKMAIVKLIRKLTPQIIICQDPEHSYLDLDPDRREAMTLYIEAVSLAARDWQVEECGGYDPHMIDSIYFMTPSNPNCVVDIAPYFELKEAAMAKLTSQLGFSVQVLSNKVSPEALKIIIPEYEKLKDDPVSLGKAMHREMDRAYHLYHGLISHTGFALAEPYRKAEKFEIKYLI